MTSYKIKKNFLRMTEFYHLKIFGHEMSATMREFMRSLSWSFFGIFLNGVALFVINIAVGRLLGPVGYGKYTLVMVAANLLTLPILLGLDTTSIKYLSHHTVSEDDQKKYLSNSFYLVVCSSLFFLILGFLLSSKIEMIFQIKREFMLLALFTAISLSFKNLFDGFVRSFHLFRFQSSIKIIEGAVVGLLFIVLFLTLKIKNYQTYLIILAIGASLSSAIYFYKLKDKFVFWDKEKAKIIFRYSGINIAFLVITVLMGSMDKFFVGKNLGVESVGIYNAYIASTTVFVVQFMVIFNNIFFPFINKVAEKKEIIKKIDRLSLIIFLPATLLIFFCSILIIHFFGDEFRLSFQYSLFFSVVAFLSIPGSFYKSIVLTDTRSFQRFNKLLSIIPFLFLLFYLAPLFFGFKSLFYYVLLYGIYVLLTLIFARISCNDIKTNEKCVQQAV